MKKDTLIIHFQHMEAIKALSIEERGQLLTALMEYQFEDIYPRNLPPCVLIAWKFIEPYIVQMNERYEATCAKNRANGQLGGRPKGGDSQ